jgi:hypothetical protein
MKDLSHYQQRVFDRLLHSWAGLSLTKSYITKLQKAMGHSSIETSLTETKEKYVNFYSRDKNKFIWTVEHILPQGENMPEHWVTMVAEGDKSKAREVRENWVHKLGNLTLTGYNSQLSKRQVVTTPW